MKTITKLTFAFLAMMLTFTACRKNDDDQPDNRPKKLKALVITNNDGTQSVFNYKYDTEGRLTEISLENPYIVAFAFTYKTDGRVEKIRYSYDLGPFTDFTYSYSGDSNIPDRLKFSGKVPTYTSDVIYTNNTIFYNDEDGNEYAIEGVDVANNSFGSILYDNITYTPHFNRQLKNGLETQSAINIPLSMTSSCFVTLQGAGLPLNSQVITGMENSNGYQSVWQFETDAAGYITKVKNGAAEFLYQ